jgi:hypothetical protein
VFNPESLPCLGGARNLAPGAAGAGGDGFDQLTVRGHLLAVGEIERVLQPGAQVPAEVGAALVQRPDFGTADRGDLPARFGEFQFQQDRQQVRIGRHAGGYAHHEIIFEWPRIHAGLPVHADAAHDADVKTFELGNRARRLHDVEIVLHLLDRIIEHHRRPGPAVVRLHLEIIQRAGVAGRNLRLCFAHAIERTLVVRTRGAGGVVDDDARAGLAHRLLNFPGDADLPRRQMALAGRLLAQMDMHDAGAGAEGGFCLARHLLRRHWDVVLLRIGQHAVQRAGNDGLVAHESAFE